MVLTVDFKQCSRLGHQLGCSMETPMGLVAGIEALVITSIGFCFAGIVIGWSQWFFLRRYLDQLSSWWIIVGFLEFALAAIMLGSYPIMNMILSIIGIGIIATVQWLFLRQYALEAKRLLPTNIIGSLVAVGIFFLDALLFKQNNNLLIISTIGIHLAITGVWLVQLLPAADVPIKKIQSP